MSKGMKVPEEKDPDQEIKALYAFKAPSQVTHCNIFTSYEIIEKMLLGLTDVLSLQVPGIRKNRDCIYRATPCFIKSISASGYACESSHLSFYSFLLFLKVYVVEK